MTRFALFSQQSVQPTQIREQICPPIPFNTKKPRLDAGGAFFVIRCSFTLRRAVVLPDASVRREERVAGSPQR